MARGLSKNHFILSVNFNSRYERFPLQKKSYSRKTLEEGIEEINLVDNLTTFARKAFSQILTGELGYNSPFRMSINSNMRILKKLIRISDAVIVSHSRVYNKLLDSLIEDKILIYDAADFDYELYRELGKSSELLGEVYDNEKSLCIRSDLILASSNRDKDNMTETYDLNEDKVVLAPHPIPDETEPKYVPSNRDFGFFIGSRYDPNIEAAERIIEVARSMPQEQFVIAGTVCRELTDCPENISLEGFVEESRKEELLSRAKFGLNPVTRGSGANVKILDYFRFGLPVISTPKGERGGFSSYTKTCEAEQLVSAIRELDEDELESLHNKSLEAIEEYSVNRICGKIERNLRNLR
ncbi:MAG: glycosyltransferase [Candidatus Nanohalobium sp.]